VFLIQGRGRRRWQVSRQADLDFVPGLDLKILARFEPEEDWVLEPGDMLYLPPEVAHYGIAETECLTWSVGFRAPSDQELAAGFLDFLGERLALAGRYADPGLAPARQSGRIPPALLAHVARTLARVRWSRADALEFAGRFLSEPKAHVYFTPPARPLPRARFAAAASRLGLALDRRARLLHAGGRFFLNGESAPVPPGCARWLRKLADSRTLFGVADAPDAFIELAHEWHARGFLHLGDAGSDP
jgi:50S ribosomal protein L16 3-hydroxylase